MPRIAILDDYQDVALKLADWSKLPGGCDLVVFNDHLADENAIAERLESFEMVVLNRERTPFRRGLFELLPNLLLLVTFGLRNASIDVEAATEHGVTVCGTNTLGYPTSELTWGLILCLFRNLPGEIQAMREGAWQQTVGHSLRGKVLGVIGLGRLGVPVAKIGLAFGMEVIAWSPNLTDDRAREHGATLTSKAELFSRSDVITIHMPLSDRSRGIIAAEDIAQMKETAYLVNTSRGPLVDEPALISALEDNRIAGAGLDVFDVEPLPEAHPLRRMKNAVVTPHIGYVDEENYRTAFAGVIEVIQAWLDGKPIRVIT